MNNSKKLALKISLVASTVLFGFSSTGVKIAKENRNLISAELGQPTFKIEYGDSKPQELYTSKYESIKELSKAGHQLVKDIEGEGATLLVNKNEALPLAKGSKVTLFGVQSVVPSYGGRGSAHASNPQHQVDLKEGLEKAGFEVNATMYDYIKDNISVKNNDKKPYSVANGWTGGTPKDMPFSDFEKEESLVKSLESYNDVAIMTLSRCGAENADVMLIPDKMDGLKLTKEERSTLEGLGKLKKEGKVKKVVVLLNVSNQIQTSEINKPEYGIDAVLWTGQVGINGTEAIGEILNGTINPSGSLPDTYWYNHSDNPVVQNYGAFTYANRGDFKQLPVPETNPWTHQPDDRWGKYVTYQEGVYLGYRYSETRYFDTIMGRTGHGNFDYSKVISHPFGAGLSYTTFEYSDFKATQTKEGYELSVKVTNKGNIAGKEAVQFYIQKPYTEFDIERGIEKPAVELVEFGKTGLLEANKSETITVTVPEEALRVYDRKVDKTYIITEGDYLFTAASDAHEACNNFLAKAGKTTENGMTENGDAKLVKSFHHNLDTENFSKSRATGHKITNIFDKAEINNYEGNTLEYYTRSNWSKELKKDIKLNKEMVDIILAQENSNSIQKDNGEYPKYGVKNNLQLINLFQDDKGNPIPYDAPIWDSFLDQLTFDETAELVGQGFRCSAALERLGKPKTMDHNGPTGLTQPYSEGNGLANKRNDPDKNLTPVNYTTVPVLAATNSKELAKRFGEMIGEDALWAGYNGFYGVGLNTHRSPYEGRAYEYFSEDPFLSGTMAAIECKEIQARGTNAFIKHFALNDQEAQRCGVNVWTNEQALREISLRPFELAVIDGGAANAMISLSRVGLEHATACKPLLVDFLRGELGMLGYAVSDMWTLEYNNEQLPLFLMNGLDIPDGETDKVGANFNKYKTGYSNVAWRMREAAKRTMYATLHSNAMNGFDSNTKIINITPAWEIGANVGLGIITVIWVGCLGWGTYEIVLHIKRKKNEIN